MTKRGESSHLSHGNLSSFLTSFALRSFPQLSVRSFLFGQQQHLDLDLPVLLFHHENITTTNKLIIATAVPKPNNYISSKHSSNVIRKPTTSLTRAKSCQVVEKSVRYVASYWQVKADSGELCNMSCGTHRNTV